MIVIEFFGMPRSGKSTCVEFLKKSLIKKGYSVYVISDRNVEKEVDIDLNRAFYYNMSYFNLIFEKLLNATGKFDVIILDRGFYDALVWFMAEEKLERISELELVVAKRYFDSLKPLVDIAFFFDVEPEVALERHKLKGEFGICDDYVLNCDYFKTLHSSYKDLKLLYFEDCKVNFFNGNDDILVIQKSIEKSATTFMDKKSMLS